MITLKSVNCVPRTITSFARNRNVNCVSLILPIVFLAIVIPLLFQQESATFFSRDEIRHHYPAILKFIEDMPKWDFVNYRSATTPLYHFSLSLLSPFVGTNLIAFRIFTVLISLFCLYIMYRFLSEKANNVSGFLMVMIFMLSPYFIGTSIRLCTDNMALLFTFWAIWMMDKREITVRRAIFINLLILGAVLTRQLYAWLMLAYGIFIMTRNVVFSRKYILLLFGLIPALGLFTFLWLWKGLTPPMYSSHSEGLINLDVPVFTISLIGIYGTFFIFTIIKQIRLKKIDYVIFSLVPAITFLYFSIHPVSNEYYTGRGGVLWSIVEKLPAWYGTSIVFWFLLPIGLIYLYLIFKYYHQERNYLLVICIVAWLMSNIFNQMVFQKYYEPFILFFLGYLAVRKKVTKWYEWTAPACLILCFIFESMIKFFLVA